MSKHHRQGDVLVVKCTKDDIDIKQLRETGECTGKDSVVLAEGEATGHAHRMNCHGIEQYLLNGDMYIYVPPQVGDVPVTHEEHGEIITEPGLWKVKRQREATSTGARTVLD